MDQGDDVLRERDVVGWARFLAEEVHVKFPEELADEKYRPHLSAAIDNRRLAPAEWLPWIKARYAREQATKHIDKHDDLPNRRVRKTKTKARVKKEQRRDQAGVSKRALVLLPDQTLYEMLTHTCECHRQLWNELLKLNYAKYAEPEHHFMRLKEMARAITAMRQDPERFRFAADLPSAACWDVAAELNKDLSAKPAPSYRKRGSRGYFYVRDIKVGDGELQLSYLGRIKFLKRKLPQGRILGAYIEQDGNGWRAVLRIKSKALEEGQIEGQGDETP